MAKISIFQPWRAEISALLNPHLHVVHQLDRMVSYNSRLVRVFLLLPWQDVTSVTLIRCRLTAYVIYLESELFFSLILFVSLPFSVYRISADRVVFLTLLSPRWIRPSLKWSLCWTENSPHQTRIGDFDICKVDLFKFVHNKSCF